MTGTDIVDNDQYPRQIGEAGSQPNYSQPDHLTEKELLIIDTTLYDERFTETISRIIEDRDEDRGSAPVTLLDWANAWTPPKDHKYNAHSTQDDWERLIATIKANPGTYDNVIIENEQERVSGGNMATFTYHGTTIIGFEGTHGEGREWPDNGQGFSATFHMPDEHIIDTALHDDRKALMITRKVTTCASHD